MKKVFLAIMTVLFVLIVTFAVRAATSDSKILTVALLNQDPDPASAGETFEVRIGVGNEGGQPVTNLIMELVPEYPFTLVSSEEAVKIIGTIGSYQYDENVKAVKYKLKVDKDATAGTYDLKVKYYQDGSATESQSVLSIDISNQESAEVIYIDQVELVPGKITPMKFTINNVGSAPLRDLSFQWENEDDIILPVGSDNTKYIKYIDVGESTEVEFDVVASTNADPDLYKLDLTLSYTETSTGTQTSMTTKAGVYVGGATDFDAAFSSYSGGEASFSISNIGSVSATSVTVRIPQQQGWRVTGSSSVIIGNLNEGDYTIASFTLTPSTSSGQGMPVQATDGDSSSNNARPGMANRDVSRNLSNEQATKTLKLEIIYTDSRGNRNTIIKDVAMDQSTFYSSSATAVGTTMMNGRRTQITNQSFWSKYKWYLVAAIIVFVLFVFKRAKDKQKRKDSSYNYKRLFGDMFGIENKRK